MHLEAMFDQTQLKHRRLLRIGIDEQDTYEIIAKINLYADEITNEATYGD